MSMSKISHIKITSHSGLAHELTKIVCIVHVHIPVPRALHVRLWESNVSWEKTTAFSQEQSHTVSC